ncbi:antitoxin Xre/MbcA/ParS toxin-binding domain-containing protein [Shewanella sp. GD04112]|uniref:antitoxin Xre/MbcA/ParS toxin-binding domain-containing protein n=1 Tax=Shewanella sp. GD04112 TaxID=2975434 RepID=UPI002449C620|nr:antitoxin Xre/MbcA/ParS toxin-binding domain-containing protein [Shewanella sp. GD04112]MDH0451048.1 MbcA/ParS/Xre antitoxin family protein [Shewanella sp. GD04112]
MMLLTDRNDVISQQNKAYSKAQLEQELLTFFGNDTAKIKEWLDTPIPRLDGQSPRSMLTKDGKRAELFQVLQEMKFGDMA